MSILKKISKNAEMTGLRDRAYDRWRRTINADFLVIPFIEYVRLAGKSAQDWPIFRLTASVYPCQMSEEGRPTANDMETAFRTYTQDLIKFNQTASLPRAFDFWFVLMNRALDTFLIQQFPRKDRNQQIVCYPSVMTTEDFVKNVLLQRWSPDATPPPVGTPGNPFKSYSAWHRWAMPSNALTMDIDYVEMRDGNPVAVLEVTQSNTDDTGYGLFSFLSRGFAQTSVILMIAETLNVEAWLATYTSTMSVVELLRLDRSFLSEIDVIDRERQILARHALKPGVERGRAQGIATQTLYKSEKGQQLMQKLAPHRKIMSQAEYTHWLLELGKS